MGFISNMIDMITGKKKAEREEAERQALIKRLEDERIRIQETAAGIRQGMAKERAAAIPHRASGTERRKHMLSTEERNRRGGYAPPPQPSTVPSKRKEDDITDPTNPLNPNNLLSPLNPMHHAVFGGYAPPSPDRDDCKTSDSEKYRMDQCPPSAPTYSSHNDQPGYHSPPSEPVYQSPPSYSPSPSPSYDSPSPSPSYDSPSPSPSYDSSPSPSSFD